MFNLKSARLMAETLWGRGDPQHERCNTPHGHWFECSDHGGMIVDAASLTQDERQEIDAVMKPVDAYVLTSGGQPVRAGFGEPTAVHKSWSEERLEVYVFEKDRDWCVPIITLGIGRVADMGNHAIIVEAQRLFHRYFDVRNPEARARHALENPMLEGRPDTIIAAVRTANDLERVWTQDGNSWDVSGYDLSYDEEIGQRLLSNCSAYKPAGSPDTDWVYPEGKGSEASLGWTSEEPAL